jgi:O-antigen/teichoic acid export membrane protein
MARFWGPKIFGVFMFPYTIASIVVLLIDYGFNLQLIRDVGRNTPHAHRLTSQALIIKSLLVLILIIIGSPFLILKSLDGYRFIFILLFISYLLNSYGFLLYSTFRGMGFFNKEAMVAFWSNLITFIVVGGLILLKQGPVPVAIGFIFSKGFFLGLSWLTYQRLIDRAQFIYPTINIVFKELLKGLPFAVHVALGTLYFSVDTIIIQHFLGAENVGIYQAGLRIMVGSLMLTDVLSNVYLSRMAQICDDRVTFIYLATRMTRQCMMIGCIVFVCMVGFPDLIVRLVYGSNGYMKVVSMFPFFGVVLVLRYLGASYGILLTVDDRQIVRTIGVSLSVIVSITFNVLLIPKFDLYGALFASIITHIFLTGIYIYYGWHQVKKGLMEQRSWIFVSITILYAVLHLFIFNNHSIVRSISVPITLLCICLIGITPSEILYFIKRFQRYLTV